MHGSGKKIVLSLTSVRELRSKRNPQWNKKIESVKLCCNN